MVRLKIVLPIIVLKNRVLTFTVETLIVFDRMELADIDETYILFDGVSVPLEEVIST